MAEEKPICPYCEEHIEHLIYQDTNTGAVYGCPKCDTVITEEELEAYAFVNLIWDGTGELDEMGFPPSRTDRRQIGSCGVDAGCLIIIDPCYLKYLPDTDKNWGEFCDTVLLPKTSSPDHGGQVHYGGGGVLVSTHGDGSFPVYATYDEDNCITRIEIIVRGEGYKGRTVEWIQEHRVQ